MTKLIDLELLGGDNVAINPEQVCLITHRVYEYEDYFTAKFRKIRMSNGDELLVRTSEKNELALATTFGFK